jgi:cold-inducible RNA-binding protein
MSSKVFVGNLSFDTGRDELERLFAEHGEIVDLAIPTDRLSGRPRGFAFVEFANAEQAAAAIAKLDGVELGGRNIRVNEATERPSRAPGGYGQGFGGPGGGRRPGGNSRPKGSRRNVRARKRSIW